MAMTYLTGSVIGKRADNTKWIDVAIVQLAAFPADSSEIKVQRMLERVPQNLKELLDAAWLSILTRNDEDMEVIRELLRALVLTYEDPRDEELLVLAGLSRHSDKGSADEIQKLVSRCQPLIRSRTSGEDVFIEFVNSDVKKHLLDHSNELLDIGVEWRKWQHGKMSLRCFSHIMEALGKGIQELKIQASETDKEKEKEQEEEHTDGAVTESQQPSEATAPTETPRYGLDYATRYWMRHASDATLDVAEIISREILFWKPDSELRKLWLQEYEALTGLLRGFGFVTWKALHVAASVGFLHLVSALLREGYKEEIHEYDSLKNRPVS